MIINGTSGDDTLYDIGKRDVLTGGLGADTFVLSHDGRRDIITDFTDGVDVIDFTDFNVTFEELFIFQVSAYSFVIDIRGERNQVDVTPPNIGDPPITPYSFTAADFTFAIGAAPPTVFTQTDTAAEDRLYGTGRPDVFVFAPDGMRDAVRRFELHKDKIDVSAFGTAFENLIFTDVQDGRIVIRVETIDFGIEHIVINDRSHLFTSSDLTADDFIFA
jgi:Ca2+-binding RTX toxin-like protein